MNITGFVPDFFDQEILVQSLGGKPYLPIEFREVVVRESTLDDLQKDPGFGHFEKILPQHKLVSCTTHTVPGGHRFVVVNYTERKMDIDENRRVYLEGKVVFDNMEQQKFKLSKENMYLAIIGDLSSLDSYSLMICPMSEEGAPLWGLATRDRHGKWCYVRGGQVRERDCVS